MDDAAYYLSAVIGRRPGSLEVRTTAFSAENLEALLGDEPAAITLAPEGALAPERLLHVFTTRHFAFRTPHHADASHIDSIRRWRYYAKRSYEQVPHLIRSVNSDDLKRQLFEARRHMRHALFAFVREEFMPETPSPSGIDDVILEAMKPRYVRLSTPPGEQLELANRQALQAARQDMLKHVETYSSEQLASVLDSASTNASQFAADKRKSNTIFGVRFGRDWLYPRFQFDRAHTPLKPFKEMKDVLSALTPDARGWDRLQWFLEPHEALNGRTPLEVWSQDRGQVIQAARTERWDARD
jgi:hypothetical protein